MENPPTTNKPKVYFTRILTPEKIVEMYKLLNIELKGNTAVKVHSGESSNKNFIGPEFLKPMIDHLKGTVVECNTAYPGSRMTTYLHTKLLTSHGWSKFFKTDILDSEGPDDVLEIPNGILLKKNYVGKKMKDYNSCLVLSHFKGHGMGGFGGALKQLSIGFGSTAGKCYQHSGGKTTSMLMVWLRTCDDVKFKEAMADAAYSVVQSFGKENLAYINIMKNISKDCDCDRWAKPPCMKDIGILSSTDPVALDKACVDLIYNSDDPGKKDVIDVIEKKKGLHIFETAVKLGLGSVDYELINVDDVNDGKL